MGFRVWAALSVAITAMVLWSLPVRARAEVTDLQAIATHLVAEGAAAPSQASASNDKGNNGKGGDNGKGNGRGTTTTTTTTTSTTPTTTTVPPSTTSTTISTPPSTAVTTTSTNPPNPTSTTQPSDPAVPPEETTTTSRPDDTIGVTGPVPPSVPTTTTTTRQERTGAGSGASTDEQAASEDAVDPSTSSMNQGMATFMSDEAETMHVPESTAPSDDLNLFRSASEWAWFESEIAMNSSAPIAAFRIVEAVGRALVTAGAGMAAPASATVTVVGMLFLSRRRITAAAIPSLRAGAPDADQSMHILR